MALQPLPSDIATDCAITRCDASAVAVFETSGHPNGDIRSGYCGEHIGGRPGLWSESPATYAQIITGPYVPRAGA